MVTSPKRPQSQWKWREISPRRMAANFALAMGTAGLGLAGRNYVVGEWKPALDPQFALVSLIVLVISFALFRGVKPAPWP